jgi:hypothetical protein
VLYIDKGIEQGEDQMSSSGRVKRVRPGDEIVAYCGRCKQERTHQVVALNSQGQADRVICRFCQSNHLYREIKTGTKNTSTSKKYPTIREPLISSRSAATPLRPYSGKEVYAEGDVIQHPKFGQGRVIEARDGKIDVRFGAEVRTLLHAG